MELIVLAVYGTIIDANVSVGRSVLTGERALSSPCVCVDRTGNVCSRSIGNIYIVDFCVTITL